MLIKLTERESATILAALRRWLSYPAAREADPLATGGGKYKPLDNGEIEHPVNASPKKNGTAMQRPCFINQQMAMALTLGSE
jgi:hypothetical protein